MVDKMTIEHTSTIEIDAPEGYLEVEGQFDVYRDQGAVLYRWVFNGRNHDRAIMLSLIGEVELQRIEELVYTEWMESER